MSYVNKKERIFRNRPVDVPHARSESRMKKYWSATDRRAWCDEIELRRQHILELNSRNKGQFCLENVLPLDLLFNAMAANKDNEIEKLQRRIDYLEALLDIYRQIELTPEQQEQVNKLNNQLQKNRKKLKSAQRRRPAKRRRSSVPPEASAARSSSEESAKADEKKPQRARSETRPSVSQKTDAAKKPGSGVKKPGEAAAARKSDQRKEADEAGPSRRRPSRRKSGTPGSEAKKRDEAAARKPDGRKEVEAGPSRRKPSRSESETPRTGKGEVPESKPAKKRKPSMEIEESSEEESGKGEVPRSIPPKTREKRKESVSTQPQRTTKPSSAPPQERRPSSTARKAPSGKQSKDTQQITPRTEKTAPESSVVVSPRAKKPPVGDSADKKITKPESLSAPEEERPFKRKVDDYDDGRRKPEAIAEEEDDKMGKKEPADEIKSQKAAPARETGRPAKRDAEKPDQKAVRPRSAPVKSEKSSLAKPDDSSLKPSQKTVRSDDSSLKPSQRSDKPDISLKPSQKSDRPDDSSLKPSQRSDRPDDSSLKPSQRSVRPADASLKPSKRSDRPDDFSLKPSQRSDRPDDSSLKPSQRSVRPADSSLKPSQKSDKPDDFSLKPSQRSDKPDDSSLKPSQRSVRPADSSLKPSKRSDDRPDGDERTLKKSPSEIIQRIPPKEKAGKKPLEQKRAEGAEDTKPSSVEPREVKSAAAAPKSDQRPKTAPSERRPIKTDGDDGISDAKADRGKIKAKPEKKSDFDQSAEEKVEISDLPSKKDTTIRKSSPDKNKAEVSRRVKQQEDPSATEKPSLRAGMVGDEQSQKGTKKIIPRKEGISKDSSAAEDKVPASSSTSKEPYTEAESGKIRKKSPLPKDQIQSQQKDAEKLLADRDAEIPKDKPKTKDKEVPATSKEPRIDAEAREKSPKRDATKVSPDSGKLTGPTDASSKTPEKGAQLSKKDDAKTTDKTPISKEPQAGVKSEEKSPSRKEPKKDSPEIVVILPVKETPKVDDSKKPPSSKVSGAEEGKSKDKPVQKEDGDKKSAAGDKILKEEPSKAKGEAKLQQKGEKQTVPEKDDKKAKDATKTAEKGAPSAKEISKVPKTETKTDDDDEKFADKKIKKPPTETEKIQTKDTDKDKGSLAVAKEPSEKAKTQDSAKKPLTDKMSKDATKVSEKDKDKESASDKKPSGPVREPKAPQSWPIEKYERKQSVLRDSKPITVKGRGRARSSILPQESSVGAAAADSDKIPQKAATGQPKISDATKKERPKSTETTKIKDQIEIPAGSQQKERRARSESPPKTIKSEIDFSGDIRQLSRADTPKKAKQQPASKPGRSPDSSRKIEDSTGKVPADKSKIKDGDKPSSVIKKEKVEDEAGTHSLQVPPQRPPRRKTVSTTIFLIDDDDDEGPPFKKPIKQEYGVKQEEPSESAAAGSKQKEDAKKYATGPIKIKEEPDKDFGKSKDERLLKRAVKKEPVYEWDLAKVKIEKQDSEPEISFVEEPDTFEKKRDTRVERDKKKDQKMMEPEQEKLGPTLQKIEQKRTDVPKTVYPPTVKDVLAKYAKKPIKDTRQQIEQKGTAGASQAERLPAKVTGEIEKDEKKDEKLKPDQEKLLPTSQRIEKKGTGVPKTVFPAKVTDEVKKDEKLKPEQEKLSPTSQKIEKKETGVPKTVFPAKVTDEVKKDEKLKPEQEKLSPTSQKIEKKETGVPKTVFPAKVKDEADLTWSDTEKDKGQEKEVKKSEEEPAKIQKTPIKESAVPQEMKKDEPLKIRKLQRRDTHLDEIMQEAKRRAEIRKDVPEPIFKPLASRRKSQMVEEFQVPFESEKDETSPSRKKIKKEPDLKKIEEIAKEDKPSQLMMTKKPQLETSFSEDKTDEVPATSQKFPPDGDRIRSSKRPLRDDLKVKEKSDEEFKDAISADELDHAEISIAGPKLSDDFDLDLGSAEVPLPSASSADILDKKAAKKLKPKDTSLKDGTDKEVPSSSQKFPSGDRVRSSKRPLGDDLELKEKSDEEFKDAVSADELDHAEISNAGPKLSDDDFDLGATEIPIPSSSSTDDQVPYYSSPQKFPAGDRIRSSKRPMGDDLEAKEKRSDEDFQDAIPTISLHELDHAEMPIAGSDDHFDLGSIEIPPPSLTYSDISDKIAAEKFKRKEDESPIGVSLHKSELCRAKCASRKGAPPDNDDEEILEEHFDELGEDDAELQEAEILPQVESAEEIIEPTKIIPSSTIKTEKFSDEELSSTASVKLEISDSVIPLEEEQQFAEEKLSLPTDGSIKLESYELIIPKEEISIKEEQFSEEKLSLPTGSIKLESYELIIPKEEISIKQEISSDEVPSSTSEEASSLLDIKKIEISQLDLQDSSSLPDESISLIAKPGCHGICGISRKTQSKISLKKSTTSDLEIMHQEPIIESSSIRGSSKALIEKAPSAPTLEYLDEKNAEDLDAVIVDTAHYSDEIISTTEDDIFMSAVFPKDEATETKFPDHKCMAPCRNARERPVVFGEETGGIITGTDSETPHDLIPPGYYFPSDNLETKQPRNLPEWSLSPRSDTPSLLDTHTESDQALQEEMPLQPMDLQLHQHEIFVGTEISRILSGQVLGPSSGGGLLIETSIPRNLSDAIYQRKYQACRAKCANKKVDADEETIKDISDINTDSEMNNEEVSEMVTAEEGEDEVSESVKDIDDEDFVNTDDDDNAKEIMEEVEEMRVLDEVVDEEMSQGTLKEDTLEEIAEAEEIIEPAVQAEADLSILEETVELEKLMMEDENEALFKSATEAPTTEKTSEMLMQETDEKPHHLSVTIDEHINVEYLYSDSPVNVESFTTADDSETSLVVIARESMISEAESIPYETYDIDDTEEIDKNIDASEQTLAMQYLDASTEPVQEIQHHDADSSTEQIHHADASIGKIQEIHTTSDEAEQITLIGDKTLSPLENNKAIMVEEDTKNIGVLSEQSDDAVEMRNKEEQIQVDNKSKATVTESQIVQNRYVEAIEKMPVIVREDAPSRFASWFATKSPKSKDEDIQANLLCRAPCSRLSRSNRVYGTSTEPQYRNTQRNLGVSTEPIPELEKQLKLLLKPMKTCRGTCATDNELTMEEKITYLEDELKAKDAYCAEQRKIASAALEQLENIKNIVEERDDLRKKLENSQLELTTLKKTLEHGFGDTETLSTKETPSSTSCDDEIKSLEEEIAQMRNSGSADEDHNVIKKEVQVLKKYCAKLSCIQDENSRLKKHNIELQMKCIQSDEKLEILGCGDDSNIFDLKAKLITLNESLVEREILQNRVELLERELNEYKDLPEDVEIFKRRSVLLDDVLKDRDRLAKRVEQMRGIDEELRIFKLKAERVDELERHLKLAHKDVQEAEDELDSVKNKCALAEIETMNRKTESDTLKSKIICMEHEMESLKLMCREQEVSQIEKQRLQSSLDELVRSQDDYEHMRIQVKAMDMVKAERDRYKRKYQELLKYEKECEKLQNQLDKARIIERERDVFKKQSEDLERCICEQENEIRRLVSHVDFLAQGKEDQQIKMTQVVSELKIELDKKESLLVLTEEKFGNLHGQVDASLHNFSEETGTLRAERDRLFEDNENLKTQNKDLTRKITHLEKCLQEKERTIDTLQEVLSDREESSQSLISESEILKLQAELEAAKQQNLQLQQLAATTDQDESTLGTNYQLKSMLGQSKMAIERIALEIEQQYSEWDKNNKKRYRCCPGCTCKKKKNAAEPKVIIKCCKACTCKKKKIKLESESIQCVCINPCKCVEIQVEPLNLRQLLETDEVAAEGADSPMFTARSADENRARILELENELLKANDIIFKLKEQLAAQDRVSAENSALRRHSTEVQELAKDQIEGLVDHLKDSKQRLNEAEAAHCKLKNDYRDCLEERDKLKNLIDSLKAQLAAVSAGDFPDPVAFAQLQADLENCRKEREELMKLIKQLQERNIPESVDLQEKAVSAAPPQIGHPVIDGGECEKLRTNLENCLREKGILEQTIRDLQSSKDGPDLLAFNKMRADLEQCLKEKEEMLKKINDLQNALNNADGGEKPQMRSLDVPLDIIDEGPNLAAFNKIKDDLAKCLRDKAALEDTLKNLQASFADMKDCAKLKSDLDKCLEEKEVFLKKINDLQNELLNAGKNQLRSEDAAASAAQPIKETGQPDLAAFNKLKADLEQCLRDKSALENTLKNIDAPLDVKDYAKLKADLEECLKEKENLLRKFNDLQNELNNVAKFPTSPASLSPPASDDLVAKLRKELDECLQEKKQLKQLINDLQSGKPPLDLMNENDDLKKALKNLENQLALSKPEAAVKDDSQLKDQLENLKNELARVKGQLEDCIKDKENLLKNLEAAKKIGDDKKDELQKMIESLKFDCAQLDDAKANLQKCTQEKQDLLNELDNLKKQLAALGQEKDKLDKMLLSNVVTTSKRSSKLENELGDLGSRNKQLQEENQQLKDAIKDLQNRLKELDALKQENEQLKKQTEMEKSMKPAVDKDKFAMQSTIEDLENQLRNLAKKDQDKPIPPSDDLKNKLQELTSQLSDAQKRAEAAEDALRKLKASDPTQMFNSEIADLKNRIAQLEKENENLKNQLAKADNEKNDLSKALEDAKKDAKNLKDENASLKKDKPAEAPKMSKEPADNKEAELSSLNKDLEKAKADAKRADEKFNQLLEENGDLKKKLAQNEADSNKLKHDLDAAQAAAQNAANKLLELEKDNAKCKQAVKELEAENARLKKELDALLNDAKKGTGNVADLQNEINDLKKKLAQLESLNAQLNEDNAKVKRELDQVRSGAPAVAGLQAENNKIAQENRARQAELDELKKQLQDAKSKASQLQDGSGDLQKRLQQLEAENAQLKGKQGDQEDSGKLKQKLSDLENENNKLKKDLQHCLDEAKKLNAEVDALKQNESKMKNRIGQLEGDNDKLKKDLNGALDNLKKMGTEVSGIQGDESKSKQRSSLLENENAKIQKDLAASQDAARKALGEVSGLKDENAKLRQRLAQLEAENAKLKSDFDAAKDALRKSGDDQKQLKQKLKDMEEDAGKLKEKIMEKPAAAAAPTIVPSSVDTKSLENEINRLKKELENAQNELKGCSVAKEEMVRLREQLKKFEDENAKLKKDLQAAKQAAQEAEANEKKLKVHFAELEEANKKLQKDNAALKDIETKASGDLAKISEMKDNENKLRQRLAQLEAENAKLKKDLEAALTDGRNIRDQLSAAKDEAGKLKMQLAKTDADNKKLQNNLEAAKKDAAGTEDFKQIDEKLKQRIAQLEGENSALKADLNKALDASKKCANELSRMQDEIGKLKQQLAQSEIENAKLKKDLSQAVGDAKYDAGGAQDLKSENEKLQQKIPQLENENTKLKKQLESALNDAKSNAAEFSRLQDEINQLKQKIAKMEKDNDALKAAKQQDDEKCKNLKNDYNKLQDKAKQLENDIANLRKQLEDAKNQAKAAVPAAVVDDDRKAKLESDNAKLKKELEDALKQKSAVTTPPPTSAAQDDVQNLKNNNAKLQTDLEKAKAALEAARNEAKKNAEELSKLKDNAAQLKQKIAQLETENVKLKKELDDALNAAANVKNLENENRKLKDQIKQLQDEINRLKSASKPSADTAEKLPVAAAAATAAGSKVFNPAVVGQLKDEIAQLKQRSAQLQGENAKLKEKLDALQNVAQDNEKLKQRIADLEQENAKLKQKLQELQNAAQEMDKLKKKIADQEQENAKLKQKPDELQNAVQENAKLKQKLNELQNMIQESDQLKKKIAELEQEIQNLKNEIEKLRKTSKADKDALNKALKELDDSKEYANKIKELEAELARQKKECEDKIAALKNQFDRDMQNLLKKSEENLDKLQKDLKNKHDKEMQNSQDALDKLQKEREAVGKDKDRYKNVVDDQKRKSLEIIGKVEEIEKVINKERRRSKELEKQRSELEAAASVLEQEIFKERKQSLQLQKDKDDLGEKLKESISKTKSLEDKTKDLEDIAKELAKKNKDIEKASDELRKESLILKKVADDERRRSKVLARKLSAVPEELMMVEKEKPKLLEDLHHPRRSINVEQEKPKVKDEKLTMTTFETVSLPPVFLAVAAPLSDQEIIFFGRKPCPCIYNLDELLKKAAQKGFQSLTIEELQYVHKQLGEAAANHLDRLGRRSGILKPTLGRDRLSLLRRVAELEGDLLKKQKQTQDKIAQMQNAIKREKDKLVELRRNLERERGISNNEPQPAQRRITRDRATLEDIQKQLEKKLDQELLNRMRINRRLGRPDESPVRDTDQLRSSRRWSQTAHSTGKL